MNTVPKIALGTWLMGGTKDPDPNNDDAKDIAVIRRAIDSGITLIDTAQNYAGGKCEELVGQAIAQYPRDAFQILTKQAKSELSYEEVIEGCKRSLQRLGLDYIDYFVCHAPNPAFGMREFFQACNQLYKDGLIKHVGVSNFGPKALQTAVDTSDIPISLNQVSFSLADYDIITTGTYDFCVQHNIPIQAYRTLVNMKDNPKIMSVLTGIAEKYGITPQQAALAYLNSYDQMLFTIRASSKKHWQQIKDALDLALDSSDIEKLKSLHQKAQGANTHFLSI